MTVKTLFLWLFSQTKECGSSATLSAFHTLRVKWEWTSKPTKVSPVRQCKEEATSASF